MGICCIFKCRNRPEWKKRRFFYVPRIRVRDGEDARLLSIERRQKCFAVIKRKDLNQDLDHHRMCEEHFVSRKMAGLFETSSVDWLPTLKLGYGDEERASSHSLAATDRLQRRQDRKRKLDVVYLNPAPVNQTSFIDIDNTTLSTSSHQTQIVPSCSSVEADEIDFSVHDNRNKEIQTEMTSSDINLLEEEINNLSSKIYELKIDAKKITIGTKEWFEENDEKVNFYTRLPGFYILSVIFEFTSSKVTHSSNSRLTQFQEFIMTLIRFRLNLTLQDLAYRFGISVSTTSAIILKWIDILFVRLSPLIKWPTREELIETTPMSFRQHFRTKVAVIIDCFEIFCNQPKNLLARAKTFSSYKHHNTVKILIGITPQGVISFISKAWGGRTSDRYLTESSGFLKNLLPGDVVLADRGFDMENLEIYQQFMGPLLKYQLSPE